MNRDEIVDKEQAVKAINTVLRYCEVFHADNKARVKQMQLPNFKNSGRSLVEAKRQLANHKGQARHIKKIQIMGRTISNILNEHVTYRK